MEFQSTRSVRFFLHLVFWLGYLIFSITFIANTVSYGRALQLACINGFFHSLFAYLNIIFWIPLFLAKRRFIPYGFIIILQVVVFTYVRFKFFTPLWIALVTDKIVLDERRVFVLIIISNLAVWIISTGYRLTEDWLKNLNLKAQLVTENLEAELKFLKTQINPHFLFNTLNNLYTLCLLKDDKAAPIVMKLSNMMRYMLYESSEDTIPLEKEINLLEDFIELQKLKTERIQDIDFKVENINTSLHIPPMLLLTLLENGFKHGDVDTNPKGWIKARLSRKNHEIHFVVENSLSPLPKKQIADSGIGLKNVKRRLSLLYPEKHQLEIYHNTNTFKVNLQIQMDGKNESN